MKYVASATGWLLSKVNEIDAGSPTSAAAHRDANGFGHAVEGQGLHEVHLRTSEGRDLGGVVVLSLFGGHSLVERVCIAAGADDACKQHCWELIEIRLGDVSQKPDGTQLQLLQSSG